MHMRIVERIDDELGADVRHRTPENAQGPANRPRATPSGSRGSPSHQSSVVCPCQIEPRQVARGVIGRRAWIIIECRLTSDHSGGRRR